MIDAEAPAQGHGFSRDELIRYARQLSLKGFGVEAQARLKASSVLLVGAGGLGAPVALYLAAAGLGRMSVIDADRVELGNLQRQILYDTGALDKPKIGVLRTRLTSLNPEVRLSARPERLDEGNAKKLIRGHDLVIDGTDNLQTRRAVGQACRETGVPLLSGAVEQFSAQIAYLPGPPCLTCLWPDLDHAEAPDCAEAGILGAVTGMTGSAMALEAIKALARLEGGDEPRLLIGDLMTHHWQRIDLSGLAQCAICSGSKAV
ncbi:MAG: HesA/MoeB/ThiF family protein [Alphaproteobacteria bacterium]